MPGEPDGAVTFVSFTRDHQAVVPMLSTRMYGINDAQDAVGWRVLKNTITNIATWEHDGSVVDLHLGGGATSEVPTDSQTGRRNDCREGGLYGEGADEDDSLNLGCLGNVVNRPHFIGGRPGLRAVGCVDCRCKCNLA